jgi:4a-hydroxytetrahydrobiopterin dehydratase
MSILSQDQVQTAIKQLPGWEYKDSSICKTFKFDNYMASIDFINLLAKKAEAFNHHPDMVVGWCQVDIAFTSHEHGGVTTSCIEMGRITDSII